MTDPEITERLPGRLATRGGWQDQFATVQRAATDFAALLRPRLAPLNVVTGTGYAILISTLLAWIAATDLHWVELGVISVLGLVLFVLCVATTLGGMALRVELVPDDLRIEIGARTNVTVTVENTAARRGLVPIPAEIELPDGTEHGRVFELSPLAPGAARVIDHFDVHGARRGVVRLGPATAVRADLFGLVRRSVVLPGGTEVLVHPRRVPLPSSGSGLLHDLEGRTTEHISASDLEFHTLREYTAGDDARHIHWRSSAKLVSARPDAGFLVRQFLETRLTHLLVLVDGDRAAYGDPAADFETAISAGASLAERALKDKLQLTFLVADRLAHEPSIPQALDACSRAQADTAAGPAALIARGLRVAPRTTSVVLVTGDRRAYEDLRRLARRVPRGVRTVVIAVDPTRETGVAAVGHPTLLHLKQLGELRVLMREGAAA